MIRLTAVRRERGVTQTKMAKLLGISQGHYSKLESQQFPIDRIMLIRIAQILRWDDDPLKLIEEV